jgi:hypothetical protein
MSRFCAEDIEVFEVDGVEAAQSTASDAHRLGEALELLDATRPRSRQLVPSTQRHRASLPLRRGLLVRQPPLPRSPRDRPRSITRLLQTFGPFERWVAAALLSPDESRVIVATGDKKVRILDAVVGTTLRELPGYTFAVEAMALSPDGSRLTTVGRDLMIWEDRRARSWLSPSAPTARAWSPRPTMEGSTCAKPSPARPCWYCRSRAVPCRRSPSARTERGWPPGRADRSRGSRSAHLRDQLGPRTTGALARVARAERTRARASGRALRGALPAGCGAARAPG